MSDKAKSPKAKDAKASAPQKPAAKSPRSKRAGKAPPVISEPRPSNVINLMDALRRSAQGERRQQSASRGNGTRTKRATPKRKVRRAS